MMVDYNASHSYDIVLSNASLTYYQIIVQQVVLLNMSGKKIPG